MSPSLQQAYKYMLVGYMDEAVEIRSVNIGIYGCTCTDSEYKEEYRGALEDLQDALDKGHLNLQFILMLCGKLLAFILFSNVFEIPREHWMSIDLNSITSVMRLPCGKSTRIVGLISMSRWFSYSHE